MALIIEPRGPEVSFASGLQSGLQSLLQNKLQEVAMAKQRSQTASGLEAFGYSPKQAKQLSMLPPKLLETGLKDMFARSQQSQGRSLQEGYNILHGGRSQQQQVPIEETLGQQKQSQQVPGQESLVDRIDSRVGQQEQPPTEDISQDRSPIDFTQYSPEDAKELSKAVQEKRKLTARKDRDEKKIAEREARSIRKEEGKEARFIKQQEVALQKHIDLKEAALQKHIDLKEATLQRHIDKETLPFYDDISKKGDRARINNRRLLRMEQLAIDGKLTHPGFVSLFNKVSEEGLFGFKFLKFDLKFLLSPESVEFRQLSKSFAEGAKDIYGARLTDLDLRSFFDTIPTLMQTNEGKLRVIQALKNLNDAGVLKQNIMNEIIKNNNGERPHNIKSLVSEKADPTLDKWAEEFRELSTFIEKSKASAKDPFKIIDRWATNIKSN